MTQMALSFPFSHPNSINMANLVTFFTFFILIRVHLELYILYRIFMFSSHHIVVQFSIHPCISQLLGTETPHFQYIGVTEGFNISRTSACGSHAPVILILDTTPFLSGILCFDGCGSVKSTSCKIKHAATYYKPNFFL